LISNTAYGVAGKRQYTYPSYGDSVYPSYYTMMVNPGYYSDGTNWVQVGDSTATTGYNNGEIIEVGTCQSGIFYYYNKYDRSCNMIESGGILQLLSLPYDVWYNNTYSQYSYQLFGLAQPTNNPEYIFSGHLFNSSFCSNTGGGGFGEFQP